MKITFSRIIEAFVLLSILFAIAGMISIIYIEVLWIKHPAQISRNPEAISWLFFFIFCPFFLLVSGSMGYAKLKWLGVKLFEGEIKIYNYCFWGSGAFVLFFLARSLLIYVFNI